MRLCLPVMFFCALYIYKYILRHIFTTGAIIAQIGDFGEGGRGERRASLEGKWRLGWGGGEGHLPSPFTPASSFPAKHRLVDFCVACVCVDTDSYAVELSQREGLFIGKCCRRRGGFQMGGAVERNKKKLFKRCQLAIFFLPL